ncbi:MAG: hypothetical protein ACK4NC_07510, partial [Candidatus Gracilibacteria bacterium]
MQVPYRAIVLHEPYFADILSQGINLEFCLCIYQFSSYKIKNKNQNHNKYTLEVMDHDELQWCIYSNELINSIPPVDRDILESMRVYESEIISMIYRWLNLSYTEARRHYHQHLKFWSWYLKSKKINLFIGVVPHETYYSVIYYLCRLMSIRTILFHPLAVPNFFTLMSDWKVPDHRVNALTQEYLNSSSTKLITQWSPQFIDFINDQNLCKNPPYMNQSINRVRKNKLVSFLIYLKYTLKLNLSQIRLVFQKLLKLIYKHNRKLSLYNNNLQRKIYDSIANLIFELYYENICTVLDKSHLEAEPYIYVALHYQPECTTLPLGDFFENQIIMIEWLSYSRPKGVWLYCKEHPSQTYEVNTGRYRYPDFYNDILKMPRVRLVSRRCSSFDLIKNSLCVSTITGTATLEAMYQEKPVLFFGYHVYQYAPGVFPIRSLRDCSTALEKICNE